MNLIRDEIREENYEKALKELFLLISDENYDSYHTILEAILEIQKNGIILNEQQLSQLDIMLDMFDDDLQDLTIQIHETNILNSLQIIQTNKDFLQSKLNYIEPTVKDRLIDFLIELFLKISDYEKDITKGLISGLNDELWTVRMKIIGFLNDIFPIRPQLIKQVGEDLEILLEEKDIDVSKEGLDLLLRLFVDTYNINDVDKLVESIQYREWNVQNKILFLIRKLAFKREDLIKPITKDLVKLLDHKDFLVTKEVKKTIEEIIDSHPNIFDQIFLECIIRDEIDNINAVYEILSNSLNKYGFDRFYELFRLIKLDNDNELDVLGSLIRDINARNQEFMEFLFLELISDIISRNNKKESLKLKKLLNVCNLPNLNYTCYEKLIELEELTKFKELTDFLTENSPLINLNDLQEFIKSRLNENHFDITEILDQFQVEIPNLLEFFNEMVKQNNFEIAIVNDVIKKKLSSDSSFGDVILQKKWMAIEDPEQTVRILKLKIRIENNSDKIIQDLKINLNFPEENFTKEIFNKNQVDNHKLLAHKDIIFSWTFIQTHNQAISSKQKKINVFIHYEREGKLFATSKTLEIV